MGRSMTYEEKLGKHAGRVLEYLWGRAEAEGGHSIPTSAVRRFLHSSSADAFLVPIIARLRAVGMILPASSADAGGVIYLPEERDV